MLSNSDLLLNILRIALTTAAMTIPAISIAYFLISRSREEGERKRLSRIIAFGSISAIVLVFCSLITFGILCLGYGSHENALIVPSVLFIIGCILLLYVLLILAGFKREIIMPSPEQPQRVEQPR